MGQEGNCLGVRRCSISWLWSWLHRWHICQNSCTLKTGLFVCKLYFSKKNVLKQIIVVKRKLTDISGVPFSMAVVCACLSLFLSSDCPIGIWGTHWEVGEWTVLLTGQRDDGRWIHKTMTWPSASILIVVRCCSGQITLSHVEGLTVGDSEDSADFVVPQRHPDLVKAPTQLSQSFLFPKSWKIYDLVQRTNQANATFKVVVPTPLFTNWVFLKLTFKT